MRTNAEYFEMRTGMREVRPDRANNIPLISRGISRCKFHPRKTQSTSFTIK